jgi:hypothetical protein
LNKHPRIEPAAIFATDPGLAYGFSAFFYKFSRLFYKVLGTLLLKKGIETVFLG